MQIAADSITICLKKHMNGIKKYNEFILTMGYQNHGKVWQILTLDFQ